ncbi:polysaccharide deacetylase family protein [Stigmatella erecta]|uniref:Polysaccharide deacetylase n=1 Tax=Stigmatella erecta TaxID=83460 RepID=A0A1I0J9R8_9BACT|nr:polysaccharide deacetylase family protein [Stigmatella erecta]SEU06689.1 Polysaccharide deacetylase [Stigmatella erecta]
MRFQPLVILWRRGPHLAAAVATGMALVAACSPSGTAPLSEQWAPLEATSQLPPRATVISLIFSDTLKSQKRAGPLFARHGLHAAFYVNSSRIDSHSAYLSREDLQALAEAGHEVGSHTAGHKNLEDMPLAEVRQQVCDDRAALMHLGFSVTSFAYPFSSDTPTVRQVIEDCGFRSASATGLIRHPRGCAKCPLAETLPPLDPLRIRAVASVQEHWTLKDLQSLVLQAEGAGGGWITLSFHQICDGCAEYGISETKLAAFLAWLAPRSSRGTYVRTPHEVIGGPVNPPVPSNDGVAQEGPAPGR